MERTILHVDCNKFYASVECLHRPELRDKPVAVGGDPERRHGIVLTKNEIAARYGVKTGEPFWKARQKCPGLVIVPPDFPLYQRFSKLAREIYGEYTNQVEPFGLDEAWLDVTGSTGLYGGGGEIAEEIRCRIKNELGITVSIGVSDNKVFAKLGSDYKKPDAVTVFSKENYREKVWPLPASSLLYVGRATERKLARIGVTTIGGIANMDIGCLRSHFGKWGELLYVFANGLDCDPVKEIGSEPPPKSIGNSTTTPRDLVSDEDVKLIFQVLAESVSRRMREQGVRGRTLSISVRDAGLFSFTRQKRLQRATSLTNEIAREAMALFEAHYTWQKPIRSVGLSMADLTADCCEQIDFFEDPKKRQRLENLDRTIDGLRDRFGYFSVGRAAMLSDRGLTSLDPYDDHLIHPVGYLNGPIQAHDQ